MISKEEWDKLKESEKYGMWLNLYKKLEALEKRMDNLEDGKA